MDDPAELDQHGIGTLAHLGQWVGSHPHQRHLPRLPAGEDTDI